MVAAPMTPADLASCGEAAEGAGLPPSVDVWSGIWNRQGTTISLAGPQSLRTAAAARKTE